MHILNTDFAAVSLMEYISNLSKSPLWLFRHEATPAWKVNEKFLVEVLLREPIMLNIQKSLRPCLHVLIDNDLFPNFL